MEIDVCIKKKMYLYLYLDLHRGAGFESREVEWKNENFSGSIDFWFSEKEV